MKLKALMEKREDLQKEMEQLVNTAEAEERTMTQEEIEKFDQLEEEIRAVDKTIERTEKARKMDPTPKTGGGKTTEEEEVRAFEDFVLGKVSELRAGEQNVSMSNNGAIIPTSIANRIIKAVEDRCPILAGSTVYSVKGNLKVPVWGKANSTHDIAVGYSAEFTELTADAGKFSSVDLGGYLVGALVLIGKSVETNAQFNITEFIVSQMAEEIAGFIEKELLTGTGNSAMQGACNTTNVKTAASATAITADELIELQSQVKQVYQANACWTMAPSTFLALKKLKDNNGRYLLQDDVTGAFPYRILGKPVYLSDNMPTMEAGATSVLYGDYSGMSVNIRENVSIQILREKYATQHAIGVNGWLEMDAKITDNAKLAVLKQKSS